MFKRNVLILVMLVALFGCKEKQHKITEIYDISTVVIKFTIPNNHVVASQPNPKQQKQIRSKLLQQYPQISHLHLRMYSNISGTGYYEYIGTLLGEKVIFFVFDSSSGIAIDGFKSKILPETETRYEFDLGDLHIYKKILAGKSATTVEIVYQTKNNSIHFGADDGFSVW